MITTAAYNERVRVAMRQQPLRGITRRGAGGRARHKWAVTVSPAGEQVAGDFGINPLTGLPYFSDPIFRQRIEQNREWIVRVGSGSVNTVAAKIGTVPLWQKPTLTVTAPTADGRDLGDFSRVSPGQRPPAFRTRRMWDFDLYRTSVVISGTRPQEFDVLADIPFLPPAATLVGLLADVAIRDILATLGIFDRIALQKLKPPYRVRAFRAPNLLDGTEDFRLAWLWLAREPGAPPKRDTLSVQQICHWNLAAYSVLEDDSVLQLAQFLQLLGDIGQITAQTIVQTLLDATKVRWWSL